MFIKELLDYICGNLITTSKNSKIFIFHLVSSTLKGHMSRFLTFKTDFVFYLHYSLSEHKKVSFMSAQSKHNQVSICSVDAMTLIWIIIWLSTLRTNEVKNLVFTFTGHECIREN